MAAPAEPPGGTPVEAGPLWGLVLALAEVAERLVGEEAAERPRDAKGAVGTSAAGSAEPAA